MTTFEVKDMTCGHCIKAITQAVMTVDSTAKVQIDLSSHRVQIESVSAEAELSHAIVKAGYSPIAKAAEHASYAPVKTTGRACCCH
ncbi:heavy-metal-associated domain-containing protein [Pseudomonas peli]|uniref:heavy-metal-associated domain-containing protein n=1 Tax=Pseudomonas peli TaxID=592361 RepID=UPI003D312F8B